MCNKMIHDIEAKAHALLVELGCVPEKINGEFIYMYQGGCLKFTFIKGLEAFVTEFAESADDAEKKLFEDCDIYAISMGETELLTKLKNDIVTYFL